ncbi:hypothetical protein ACFL6K_01550 [Candidatus Latescibacterota bacterium]
MKNNISVKHVFMLILLISLVCLQTVFSNFVICVGEDGHVDVDISITNEKLATNHHKTEHNENSECSDDFAIHSEKHFHGCYDILFSFSADNVKVKANADPSLNTQDYSLIFLPSLNGFENANDFAYFCLENASFPPGISLYLSANISLLI